MGRFNKAQWQAKLNQAKSKRRAAIQELKNLVNKRKQHLRQAEQKIRHIQARIRARSQRLIYAQNTFQNISSNQRIITRFSTQYTQSVTILNSSYEHLEHSYDNRPENIDQRLLIELPEQENTNNIMLYNSLAGKDEDDGQVESDLQRTVIEEFLFESNPDFCNRWQGAIYALDPRNIEASRHFCTSAREICIEILDTHAPDEDVKMIDGCVYTQNGHPTRRSKVKYLLDKKSVSEELLENFIEEDLDSLLNLFGELNKGTHGKSGKFGIPQLLKLKKRVEDYIKFLQYIVT